MRDFEIEHLEGVYKESLDHLILIANNLLGKTRSDFFASYEDLLAEIIFLNFEHIDTDYTPIKIERYFLLTLFRMIKDEIDFLRDIMKGDDFELNEVLTKSKLIDRKADLIIFSAFVYSKSVKVLTLLKSSGIEDKIDEIETSFMQQTDLLKTLKTKGGKSSERNEFNLLERYEIANELFGIKNRIDNFNVRETDKHDLISKLLGCNFQVARELYNGTYHGRRANKNEDKINEYLNKFKLIESV